MRDKTLENKLIPTEEEKNPLLIYVCIYYGAVMKKLCIEFLVYFLIEPQILEFKPSCQKNSSN